METVIVLRNHTITVHYGVGSDSGGSVDSNLGHDGHNTIPERAAYHAIESLVLSHATSGVNIASEEYKAGLQNTLDSLVHYLDRVRSIPHSAYARK